VSENGYCAGGTEQATLLGDEAERAECEYYDGCKNPALFIDEVLHYGEGEKPVKMCESCADEHTEIEGNEVQRLKPEDRYVSELPEKMTVWVVVTNHVNDPHPQVEGVYDNEEAAREHGKELRDDVIGPVAWWVYNRSVDTGTDRSKGGDGR